MSELLSNSTTYVLDSSAMLEDGPLILDNFAEGSRILICTPVVKELERIRNGSDRKAYFARRWMRFLKNALESSNEEENYLIFRVKNLILGIAPFEAPFSSVDEQIVSFAKSLQGKENRVVLVTNDLPLRIIAEASYGVETQDYLPQENCSPFDGKVDIVLDSDFLREGEVQLSRIELNGVAKDLPSHALASVNLSQSDKNYGCAPSLLSPSGLEPISRNFYSSARKPSGIKSNSLEQLVAIHYLMEDWDFLPLVSLSGRAGTGKTLLSLSAGIQGVLDEKYSSILVVRSLHEMGKGQEMGFLPGTVDDKMDPWKATVNDALKAIKSSSANQKGPKSHLLETISDHIEVSPITYMRGRSLTGTFIIIEEAQNFSKSEILNIVSRAGEGTKIVLTWDPDQVDNRYLKDGKNCDMHALVDRFKSEDLFAHINLVVNERSAISEIASRILSEI